MTTPTENKVSPMMAQWHACKEMSKDAILFFRMGDFYEAFYDDASLLAKELELTLTHRQGIPMSGVPHHTCESYIDKLVAKGFRVAVAEQTEDPKEAKGLVKRELVRIVTPGTVINSSLLSDKANNFFISLHQVGSLYGMAVIDLTTAEFRLIELQSLEDLANEIYRLRPRELLASPKFQEAHRHFFNDIRQSYDYLLSSYDDWRFDHQIAHDFLIAHFGVHSLDGFGLKGMTAGLSAAGSLLSYLQENLCLPIEHIMDLTPYSTSEYMVVDRATQRNLELTESLQDGSRRNTLLAIMDNTHTPMGARLMRHWVKQPLLNVADIQARQDGIQAFLSNSPAHKKLIQLLDGVRDLERIMMKITSGYATPRDLVTLRFSLSPIPQIKQVLQAVTPGSPLLKAEEGRLSSLPEMTQLISTAIVDEPPARVSDGGLIREGYHTELDELRSIRRDGKSWLANYQIALRDQTGIKTLKVSYNRMFGYYIEVSKGQADNVPETFQRRQTLVNAERFITPELKEYEGKVLNAEERISAIETELFTALRLEISKYAKEVQATAQALARIDCIHGLAETARLHSYCRPIVDDSQLLQIIEGRHPVIEGANIGEKFVPNDTLLDDGDNRLLLITGPNMAGKSTYIRQVALIAMMAQMGSFVPAKSAHIGVVDKVFSRIGASDDLSRGQSTFMVEMSETANILNNATSRSLVILDEIGRGTSTYDGISIAWSVAEFLLTAEGQMAKTLFATHYWELTKLEEKVPGAVNYNVAVHESEDSIIFLRKIIRGGTDKSYGIHVGRLAGLPPSVIARAKEILVHLEENANRKGVFEPAQPSKPQTRRKKIKESPLQLSLFY